MYDETRDLMEHIAHLVKVLDKENEEVGWVHLRQSIHNPNLALNIQSSLAGGCLKMARSFRDEFLMVTKIDQFLDISQVDKFATSELAG